MATQPKKGKKADDAQIPPDAGQKPIQLQRRRVWRACESCRCVHIVVSVYTQAGNF
jgi:hypothetical protein